MKCSTIATPPFSLGIGIGQKVGEDEVAAGRASNEPLTLFVKNLSFSTTEAGLKSCFENAGLRVRSVSIPRKRGKGSSEAMLSTGFGFVECADRGLVDKALNVGNANHVSIRDTSQCRIYYRWRLLLRYENV